MLYSHRLRLFGRIAVVVLLATCIYLQPTWKSKTYDYARNFSQTVSSYIGPSEIYNNTLYQELNEETGARNESLNDACTNFPSTMGIQFVMKTGATEVFDKLPMHLLTAMQCLPDFLIFSDMTQQLGRYHIYDVLEEVDESVKAHNNDFNLYRDQNNCPVSQKSCLNQKEQRDKAWNLDKYKFLPMMERTWRMRPGRDWYVFAEADTYVFWGNMVYWLRKQSRLDYKEKHFLGSRSFLAGTPFAHGGSGYVLSGTLLKHLIKHYKDVVKKYNIKTSKECCGDLILAQALDEFENTKMRQAWPMFNGEKPSTLPFGPGHWCEPILTMHHMDAEEVSSVWQFERMQKTDSILLMKDLYLSLVAPKMQTQRQNWDNLSDDICYINPDKEAQTRASEHERSRQKKNEEMTPTEREAWRSSTHCARVCGAEGGPTEDKLIPREETPPLDPNVKEGENTEMADDRGNLEDSARITKSHAPLETVMNKRVKTPTCFQYRWHDEVCCTARSFKLGVPKPITVRDKEINKWVSGWDMKAISEWIGAMGECKHIAWKTPEA